MTIALWILVGWLAAASIFVFGCHWGSRSSRREIDQLTEERDVLNMATKFLLACLYGGDDDPDDELQRLLDSGGGAA